MKGVQKHESHRKPGHWLIEAVAPVRFTYRGESILLEPGQRIRLPPRPAQQLMARARDCVHAVDWLALWRDVADLSSGVQARDPRFSDILGILDSLDRAFADDDPRRFRRGFHDLREAMTSSRHDA